MAERITTSLSNCSLCEEPDNENMVTCSNCLHSYHEICCNMDSGADIFLWKCRPCIFAAEKQNTTHNLISPNTSLTSSLELIEEFLQQPSSQNLSKTQDSAIRMTNISNTQLQLQKLEEEMRLKEEYLRRKYELLAAADVEGHVNVNESQTRQLRPVSNSETNNVSSVRAPCVQNCPHNGNSTSLNNASTNYQKLAQSQTFSIYSPPNKYKCQCTKGLTLNIPNNNYNNNMRNVTQLNAIEENTNINKNKTQNRNSSGANNSEITTTQLVARQCIPRDLPIFNGDPKEWPIFISAFEQSNRVAGYKNEENLIRLQNCLRGRARETVRNCLMLPEMVPDIIRTLKMYFGRPEGIIKTLIEEVRRFILPRGKLEPMIEFAFAVKNLCATIRAAQLEDYLINPIFLQELIEKLPPDYILQWALYAKDISRPNLADFSDWLYIIAEAACKVTAPVFESIQNSKPPKREGRLNTHSGSNTENQQKCLVCSDFLKLTQCLIFRDLPIHQKWDTVNMKNLCPICLGKHRRRCWFKKPCGVNGCSVLHNSLLHTEEQPAGGTVNNHTDSSGGDLFYRIVPVTLYSDEKSITIYALLDDGSTLTLLEEGVANSLGVKGTNDPLCILWTGDVSRFENDSRRFDLKISSTKTNSKLFQINSIYTVKNLNLPKETMIVEDIKNKYPHLKNIPLESYMNVAPSMIIGVNNPNLITSIKVKEGGWQQPVASKTRLGWTLFGGGSKSNGRLNFHKCSCEKLHSAVRQYFADESIGITSPESIPMSNDDKQALDILDKTCKFNEGRYEVGLLWRPENPKLPNSLPTAIKRLKCIKKKSLRDPELFENLNNQISNLEKKGYAEKLPISVLQQNKEKVWYLPTFIVKNPHKPNKVRLVWDAAAKSGDFALNDFLLKGPDLLMPLINILFKFRVGAVAVCGDIAEMFHRIKVRKEDAGAQRFLWWDKDNSLIVYQLNVLTFGASCSPCISHYVRDKNANHFGSNQEVIEAITQQHYVDDFIDSTNTVKNAIQLALDVRDVHAKGGFYMRNWSSNSPDVLNALGETKGTETKSFESSQNSTQFEKILGLYWDPKDDIFKMNLHFVRLRRPILNGEIVPTKREVLQVLMSVFDPLGFVACFMSYLKSILQEIWRCGLNWDQPLNDDIFCKWKNWLTFLPTITAVSIPRCYSLALQSQDYIAELHTFVDASEDAYAAVSYFRIELDGKVEIKLVAAKSKVAPLRPLSIPRLELQAAAIGARLMNSVSNHKIKLMRKIMWTDSATVLTWLRGDPRKFKQFVMFRIAEILKFTNVSDWRWVPSMKNVADFATKYRPSTDNYKEWFDGPSWLKLHENEWPKSSVGDGSNIGEIDLSEIRPRYLNVHTRKSIAVPINFEYFSSWFKLYRAIANWIMYVERKQQELHKERLVDKLNATHFNKAKRIIFKTIQMLSFPDEYAAIQHGKINAKGGAFNKLDVYIDDYDIVRVRNRARYAPLVCGLQRDLILLPGKHHLTKLIVMHYHQAYHHSNHETIINEIRQKYYIVKLRMVYKLIRRSCQKCKIDAAKPVPPQMAPLPPARLGAFQRPFTFVGVDYFGPIAVTFGRKSLKRWGVIFTCLTIRAIHIEIAHTLSTDSFLMVLKSFIARRGTPAEIYSDNGTNFRGADRFLKEEFADIKFDDVQTEAAYRGILWRFNPPAAPHMGGVWERLVRSIKTILYKISPSQKFTDESLRSALMEVELIVNSRPLTYVSLEAEDQEAITPNHFLLGSSDGAKPLCNPENINHRMCLRQSELFANMFWKRFVKEMLPTLTRRSKWTQRAKLIEEGDIVIIVDENSERNLWLRGRVIEVTKAKDGQVRRAKVKTKHGVIERPAVKLAVLDVDNHLE